MTAGPIRSNAAAPDEDAGAKLLKLESDLGAARREATELRRRIDAVLAECDQTDAGFDAHPHTVSARILTTAWVRAALAGGATREPQTSEAFVNRQP